MTSATAPGCASASGWALDVRRPRRPETGNLQAWARDERYGAAAQLATARGADVAAGHTGTDQVETILYRLASSPSRRALLGMRPREGLLVRPLLELHAEQTAAYCARAGAELARGRDERRPTRTRAGESAHGLVPALQAVHPAAVGQRAGAGGDPARRGRRAAGAGRRDARRAQGARARAASGVAARARAARRCSGWRTAPPAARRRGPPGAPRRSSPCVTTRRSICPTAFGRSPSGGC